MSWMTPRQDYAISELVTAADLNQYLGANPAYLYDQAYGLMQGSRTTLGSAAATLGVSGLDTNWEVLIVRASLRSVLAATSDTIRLRLGGAALDTTAGNYYGYNDAVAGTAPTRFVAENLGAAAGIFVSVTIDGGNAPANYFAQFEAQIVNGNVSGEEKRGMFRCMWQLANTTGNVGITQGQGKWLNLTNTLQQISFITASGSNLAAGSWVSVYGGAA